MCQNLFVSNEINCSELYLKVVRAVGNQTLIEMDKAIENKSYSLHSNQMDSSLKWTQLKSFGSRSCIHFQPDYHQIMSASVGRGDEKWKPDLNKFDFNTK